jgi:hypothetical protein
MESQGAKQRKAVTRIISKLNIDRDELAEDKVPNPPMRTHSASLLPLRPPSPEKPLTHAATHHSPSHHSGVHHAHDISAHSPPASPPGSQPLPQSQGKSPVKAPSAKQRSASVTTYRTQDLPAAVAVMHVYFMDTILLKHIVLLLQLPPIYSSTKAKSELDEFPNHYTAALENKTGIRMGDRVLVTNRGRLYFSQKESCS